MVLLYMFMHETYMQRCLDLAKLAIANAYPNPMVGSVIVHNGGIIGEGYHQKCGEAHAEVNAIKSVKDKSLLKHSTIYVNLEPCAHFGKTPPCSDLIIEMGIPHVVIGCVDSFSEVAGKGIEKLKKAGVKVEVGILEKEALDLNRRFFTFHEKDRPYVILKWAKSGNGFMDIDRKNQEKGSVSISSLASRQLVHKWRGEEQGILIGVNTLLTDLPKLDTRLSPGRNPIKIILDPNLKSENHFKSINCVNGVKVLVINKLKGFSFDDVEFVCLQDFRVDTILKELKNRGVFSLIIEGGAYTLHRFIEAELWDEARVFTSEVNIENGLKAPVLENSKLIHKETFNSDLIEIFRKS